MGKVKESQLCKDCGTEMEFDPENPFIVADEMFDFINEQDHWGKYYAPSICWGMLMAVFKVIFELAPNKKRGMQLILDAIEEFTDEKGTDV